LSFHGISGETIKYEHTKKRETERKHYRKLRMFYKNKIAIFFFEKDLNVWRDLNSSKFRKNQLNVVYSLNRFRNIKLTYLFLTIEDLNCFRVTKKSH
jgi:hypothetical protein